MTDKPLSERVAEYLQASESYGFAGMPEIQLLREQQAEIERLSRALGERIGFWTDAAAERDRLRAENEALKGLLQAIGDYAHDHSTGPAEPDSLWTVRDMAYNGAGEP